MKQKPLLAVDIDGVISLFGSPAPWSFTAQLAAGHADARDQAVAGQASAADPAGAGQVGAVQAVEGAIAGSVHAIDGTVHYLSRVAAAQLVELADVYDLVWASGWEERADEHLPYLLGLPKGLPHLTFERAPGRNNAHWKLDAIERHAGSRPLAWIDDALSEDCYMWARARKSPTLLVQTAPERGLTAKETGVLVAWARELAGAHG